MLSKFIVNKFDNYGYKWIHIFDGLHQLAWAWAQISYTIDVNGTASASFSGSLVPSQTDYWDYVSIGGYQMSGDANPFLDAPGGGILGPTSGVITTVGK